MFVLNFLKLTPFLKTINGKKICIHSDSFQQSAMLTIAAQDGYIKDTALGVCLYVKILWPSSWLLNERIYILRAFSFMTHVCTNENDRNKIKNFYKTLNTLTIRCDPTRI